MSSSTVKASPPDLDNHISFNVRAHARKYGIILGVITAVYLIIINLVYGEVPLGLRFAKHLIIIPVIWYAAIDYARRLPEGKVFKAEIGYMMGLAGYTAITLVLINVLFFMVTETSYEQFMQDGNSFAGMMLNSGFVFFETIVFVMIIAFVILQGLKGGGSPED